MAIRNLGGQSEEHLQLTFDALDGFLATWRILEQDPVQPIEDPVLISEMRNHIQRSQNALSALQQSGAQTLRGIHTGSLEELANIDQSIAGLLVRYSTPAPTVHAAYDLSAGVTLRRIADSRGSLNTTLPSVALIRSSYFDVTNRNAITAAVLTGSSGSISRQIRILTPDISADLDSDQLGATAERTLGTFLDNPDSDNDGIDDLAEIQQGLNPLDNRGFPTGIIASLPLRGEAKEVVLQGSTLEATRQLAYVATGSYGLAIVDTTRFDNPIVLGQLDLDGDAIDVAADAARQLAVVAAGAGGLHLIDVSDPMQPLLTTTLTGRADHVELYDGIAYVASANVLRAVDLATGEVLEQQTLTGGSITGMAREGNLLLTMDSNDALQAITLESFGMALRDSVMLQNGGGRLFVGGGVAYVPAASYFRGGFATVDVSNPDNLLVISESDVVSPFIGPATHLVPNGSGLGLLLGGPGGQNVADVMNLSDLTDTNQLVTRFNLPGAPFSAALGS
jgi:hypothetical protein